MPDRKPFKPRPYQSIIINHILQNTHCSIWAGMGTGKTVSVLTALDILYLVGIETKPALVLAPLRVANATWPDESKTWAHLRDITVQPITGTTSQRLAALKNTRANVFTMNYENLPWLVETFGDSWFFGPIIADESTKLKSFRLRGGGIRAAALSRIVKQGLVTRWVNLTGTPSPNGLIDLWGQQWFIDQGQRLGRTFGAFKSRWFDAIPIGNIGHSKSVPRPFASEQIPEALEDSCITIDAKDYFDIKDPICTTIPIELPPKVRQLYLDMEKYMLMDLDSTTVTAMSAAGKSQKCLQIASGAVYTDEQHNWEELHKEKLSALDSIINESAGMPVLVSYHFKSDLERLKKAFPQGRELDKDPQTIKLWNAGEIPILFAHPASAGHGLNLQDGGNILVFLSHWWDLEQYQQIIERIGPTRQAQAGHDRPVFIYYLLRATR